MSKLSTEDKKLIDLLLFNGFSYSEIAREVGVSRQAIHQLVNREREITPEIEELLVSDEEFILSRESLDSVDGFVNRNPTGASCEVIGEVLGLSAKEVAEIETSALRKANKAFRKLGYP